MKMQNIKINTIFQQWKSTNATSYSGVHGWSLRFAIPLKMSSGSRIRIKLKATPDYSMLFDHVSVGMQSTDANTVTTPTPLTFSGSASGTALAGASVGIVTGKQIGRAHV